jgi:hypothetical protein
LIACTLRLQNAAGAIADAFWIADGGAAVFLHDESHAGGWGKGGENGTPPPLRKPEVSPIHSRQNKQPAALRLRVVKSDSERLITATS